MVEEKKVRKKKERNPFVWPDLPFIELMCMVFIIVLLLLWSLGMDAPLNEIATPSRTENPAKAPWYFIGLQEILVYFDPWYAGVVLPSIILIGLMAIPYLDHNPKGVGEYTWSGRKFAITHFMIGYAMWMGFILVGQFMRGPSWLFFWPWEPWDDSAHAVNDVLVNIPNWIGGLSLLLYSVGWLAWPKIRKWKVTSSMDPVRYTLLMTFLLLMYAVPIKIILRQVFHVRYVLVTPWFNI